jgi:hypothetical protein
LPTEVALPLVLRVGGIEGQPPAKLEIELLGPQMTSYGRLDTEIELEEPPGHQPGYEISDVFPVEVRFEVNREGNHSVEIHLEERHVSTSFFVVHLEPLRGAGHS